MTLATQKRKVKKYTQQTPKSKDKSYVEILKADHDKVQALFKRFEKTESKSEKREIVETAIKELKVHTQIEEEIVYPALREVAEEDLMNEADEEHHVAKVLIEELEEIGQNDDHFDAKFTVLGEVIEHHIKEEEGEDGIFKKAKKTDVESITQQLIIRKEELMQRIPKVSVAKNK